MSQKYCPGCKTDKLLSAFDRRYDKYQSYCKECSAARRPWAMLKNRYGITKEQYIAMLEEQGGICAICNEKCKTGQRLSVDHNHNTGTVRGLLCKQCNRAIGSFKDDYSLIIKAANYVALY